jgi:hypothetical protein
MLFAFRASRLSRSGLNGFLPNWPANSSTCLARISITAIVIMVSASVLAKDAPIDLRPTTQSGNYRESKVVVEVEGKLKLNADGQDVKHLPLKVNGELHYVERVLSQSKQWSEVRLVRSYQAAQAKIRLHESDLTSDLRPDRRLVVIESNASDSIQFSPSGPLTREELELIQVPASGLALEALLPQRATNIGSQWQLSESTVARLLNLEAISQQDITCTLDSAKENIAIISLAGKVTGAVGGVSSDIELKGKLNFDLKQRAITWLTLAFKENRAIGHAQPGYEVLATLRMVSATAKPVSELSDKALTGLPLKSNQGQTLVELNSDSGGFQLIHDRRWSVMLERPDLTVLRLVDRGDLIAQCNITPRPPLGKDQQLSMEGFQQDVKRVLGNNFEEMVEATEETTESGLRVLRVVVAGKVGDLDIQWTYYHLSDNQDHRASLVFTLESTALNRFAHIDLELIGNFRFLADKNPTPAADDSPDPPTRQSSPTRISIPR